MRVTLGLCPTWDWAISKASSMLPAVSQPSVCAACFDSWATSPAWPEAEAP